jgi:MFS family permease
MRRKSVAPLLGGTFILRLSGGANTVVYGLFLAKLAPSTGNVITSLQIGLLAVVYYATELALAPLMGALSDRYGRRLLLIIGPLLGLVQQTLILFTPIRQPLPYLLSLQMLAGLSSAMQVPAVLGYLADYTARDPRRRMRVMSLYELATSGGIAAGVVVGGLAWDRLGRQTFLLLAAFYLLAAVCMALAPRVSQFIEEGNIRAQLGRYWQILRKPRLFIFIPAWICVNALVGVWFGPQLTFLLARAGHHSHQHLMGSLSGPGGGHMLSLVLGAFALFFGLSLLFWAFFLGHVSRLRLMLISLLGVFVACIALFGINHRGDGNDGVLLLWLPLLMIGVFAESGFAPAALAYLADISEAAARERGLLMGLYSIFLGAGQLLGNGLGGVFAHQWGFDGLILLTALLAFVALGSLTMLYRQERTAFFKQQRESAARYPARV